MTTWGAEEFSLLPFGQWSALLHYYGEKTMRKLLDAYKANPSFANAKRLFAYDYKHAFASIMLMPADQAVLQQAIAQYNLGE